MRVQNNKWHEVWDRRTENKAILKSQNSKEIFMELKRINGWDSTGSMLEYDQFYDQYVQTKNELEFSPRSKDNVISSVFEVDVAVVQISIYFRMTDTMLEGWITQHA